MPSSHPRPQLKKRRSRNGADSVSSKEKSRKRKRLEGEEKRPKPWQAQTRPNEEVVNMVTALTRRGLPLSTIARFIATTETRLRTWLERGESAVEQGSDLLEDRIYMTLFLQTGKALAYFEARQVRELCSPRNKFWRQNLAILERLDPRNWSRTRYEDPDQVEDLAPDQRFL